MTSRIDARDRAFMRKALAEARKALGRTRPNPIVGAVLVRAGRIVAAGHHERAGLPHAEAVVLARAAARARGATLYVTLEPCAHVGRTGPCTDEIIRAGVNRVVIGCGDKNPKVNGRGIARLRAAGIVVDVGCLEDDCREPLRAFFRWITSGRPLVTMKAAITLDGVTGDLGRRDGGTGERRRPEPRWITSPLARRAAHDLRARHDAIVVGVGTVLADDPRLTVRSGGPKRGAAPGPLRVVLDTHLRTPPACRLLREKVAGPPPLIVASRGGTGDPGFQRRKRALQRAGAEVVAVVRDRGGRPAINAILRVLARRGIQSVLVEGGSHIHASFVRARLVDRVCMFVAPRLAGGGVPVVNGAGLGVERALTLGALSVTRIGADILVTADVIRTPDGRTGPSSRRIAGARRRRAD